MIQSVVPAALQSVANDSDSHLFAARSSNIRENYSTRGFPQSVRISRAKRWPELPWQGKPGR